MMGGGGQRLFRRLSRRDGALWGGGAALGGGHYLGGLPKENRFCLKIAPIHDVGIGAIFVLNY
jgi:hypothetical protein